MPSGYHVNGVDLDSIFAPLQSGMTPVGNTEYQINGVDISQRYAPLSYGSAAAVTNYKLSGGADLNTVFAAAGSTALVVVIQPSNVSGSSAAGAPSGTVTSSSYVTCSVTGGVSPYTYTWNVSGGGYATSPNSPTSYLAASVANGSEVTGTAYCRITDSSSDSIDTNTVSYALTNTTPAGVAVTITAGVPTTGGSGDVGYSDSAGGGGIYGSISTPASGFLPSGKRVQALFDNPTDGASLVISDLASDPTQGSLVSITMNGVTYTGSSAAGYVYSSGASSAFWYWGSANKFGFANGGAYSGTVLSNGAW